MYLHTNFGDPEPWSPEEVSVFLEKVKKELKDGNIHSHMMMRRVGPKSRLMMRRLRLSCNVRSRASLEAVWNSLVYSPLLFLLVFVDVSPVFHSSQSFNQPVKHLKHLRLNSLLPPSFSSFPLHLLHINFLHLLPPRLQHNFPRYPTRPHQHSVAPHRLTLITPTPTSRFRAMAPRVFPPQQRLVITLTRSPSPSFSPFFSPGYRFDRGCGRR